MKRLILLVWCLCLSGVAWGACQPCDVPAAPFGVPDEEWHRRCCQYSDEPESDPSCQIARIGSQFYIRCPGDAAAIPLALQTAPDPCLAELQGAVRWLLKESISSSRALGHPFIETRSDAQRLRDQADAIERYDAEMARIKAIAQRCAPEETP